jgi:hypothetical protein
MERDDPPLNTIHSVQAEVAVAQAAASAERTPKNAAAKLHTRRPITEEFFIRPSREHGCPIIKLAKNVV